MNKRTIEKKARGRQLTTIGQRYQVVIPKSVRDALGLVEGDIVEVSQVKNTVVITPKTLVDAEYTPTSAEAKLLRKRMASKGWVPWPKVKHELGV